MKRIAAIALVLAAALAAPALAADLWLHVHIDDPASDETKVRVNVPLSMVGRMLPQIDVSPHLEGGRVKLDRSLTGVGDIDMRALWAEMRNAPDGEFVTVRSTKENVRVAKESGFMTVHVDDESSVNTERVRVRVPMNVLDALFSGPEDELDLNAAIEALSGFAGEDLVVVEEQNGAKIRIWIDEVPNS